MHRFAPTQWTLLAFVLIGCGPPPTIPGGTPGKLHSEGEPLREVRLTVYDHDGHPQAFAVSDRQGNFQLRKEATLEGVHLPPGSYRVTIESAGEFRMLWPKAYRSPDKSPLKIDWTAEQTEIDLDVPAPKLAL
ncbi:carboxypeptidase-like regulatory domain-containing protein [Bremerella sp. P1]|uniref:carboxypeptidase-like regulatory domain-containing protein n=1 Tax=Bremerella sp. P1 TaxID=3026424 RepID=UPI002367AD25|nr:carboxypeptidase-like regulatory domain-containing protein [Bremerella sp. P1]WDI44415.1 carboxypeptidase-like regulatory domain-containing protein [Bremerella sp. P1]